MNISIQREIKAYKALQAQVSGHTIDEFGFAMWCAPGVLPPNNRVTRCFGSVLQTASATSALDLGCGTGILALIASRTCHEVIGVDIDPRALACSRHNAALNDVTNARFLLGDGYGPIGSRRFDLVISNPPFYSSTGTDCPPASMCINTECALLYTLIQGLRYHLNPGGQALFVSSSLSDNDWVKSLLQNSRLDFCSRLLHRGYGTSQNIYLWQVQGSK